MNIIKKQPSPSGAYPPIQTWDGEAPPEGYYQVADSVTLTNGGFGKLTVRKGIVTSFKGNTAKWEAWKASLPAPSAPLPTAEERLSALETAMTAQMGV